MMCRPIPRLSLSVCLALFLGGCNGNPPESAGASSNGHGSVFEFTQSTPRVLIATLESRGGGDALVIGQLEYLRDQGCFVLDGFGDDTSRVALAWPPGTTASAEGDTAVVTVPGFGQIRPDDWLRGGGFYDSPDGDLPPMPAECSPSDVEFAVLYDVTEAGAEPLIEE